MRRRSTAGEGLGGASGLREGGREPLACAVEDQPARGLQSCRKLGCCLWTPEFTGELQSLTLGLCLAYHLYLEDHIKSFCLKKK